MSGEHEQPQPKDLSTGQRIATTGRAVLQGIAYEIRGEHEAEKGPRYTVPLSTAQRIIEEWADPPKNVARQMLDKYGPPNEATPTSLIWYRNGPWKRTEVTDQVVVHNWPAPHTDFLTQTIDYRVPPEMASEIAQFDGSIIVDRTKGEVSARCDSESANCLGLNMVHEIITRKRTVDEARETTAQNTAAYNLGRNAPYAERLLFDVPRDGTEDLDKTTIAGAMLQQTAGKLKDALPGEDEEATDRRSGEVVEPT